MSTASKVAEALRLDAGAEADRIAAALRSQVAETLRRRGLVIGLSGGVDSSVCAALAVRAVGPERVYGLMMPERDSDPESLELGRAWAEELGIEHAVEDIGPTLEALGCYARRDDAVRSVVPEYGAGWACKVGLPTERLSGGRLSVTQLTVRDEAGRERRVRLSPDAYRSIVAATNFKQRVRKMMEYHHADRLHYAVVGTPNRLEYDQGFFVKGGDGLADVKPIAHLYKTQVYQLADELGVPPSITGRAPTTDTFPMEQSQEEFYFSMPLAQMDAVLYGANQGVPPERLAAELELEAEQVQRAYDETVHRRAATRYLHLRPLLAGDVPEIAGDAG